MKSDTVTDSIDRALLSAYEQVNNRERSLQIARTLAQRAPQSMRVFYSQVMALRALHRFTEADQLAQERLKVLPGDIFALRFMVQNAALQHDYATAYARGLKVLESSDATSNDMNTVAWLSLFFNRPAGPDVDRALQASQDTRIAAPALHTLACAYAELGKAREAREILLQSMDLMKMSRPDGAYWYAFGRIAEVYGERDAALAYYARVPTPADPATEYQSAYHLAHSRMRVLAAPVKAAYPLQ